MRKSGRATILDLAEKAGVDNSTVSLALRDDPRISLATKERVKAIAKEMNYVPNGLARSLCGGRSRLIGVTLTSIENNFFLPFLDEFQRASEAASYSLSISVSAWDKKRELESLRHFCESRVEGIICVPVELNLSGFQESVKELRLDNIPMVFLSLPDKLFSHQVGVDQEDAIKAGLDYLLSLGHRRIGFLHAEEKGSRRSDLHRFRRELALRFMKERGVSPRDEDFLSVSDNAYGAVGAAGLIASRRPSERPTAMFCADDMIGRALVAGLSLAGVRVPDEISVLGFDDAPGDELGEIPLASVSLEGARQGSAAIKLLLDVIEKRAPQKPFQRILIEPRVAERASCAPRGAH